MRLPFSFPFKKKQEKNYLLALLLQDESIKAVLFEELDGKISIASHAEKTLPSLLETADSASWLDAIDHVVSTVESAVSHKLQTEQTIFGVKANWTQEGKIKKEYLSKLKAVCDELALKPIGFLVFSEAIVHLLQQEEGAPVSAILVETGKTHITISLIRAGRVIESHQMPLTQALPLTVDTGLKEFDNVEILPSRIILFNGNNNEKVSQSFISHQWSKSLPFLHVPQVTILPVNFDIRGVLVGTAAQMGFDILSDYVPPAKSSTQSEEIEHISHEDTQFFAGTSDHDLAKKIEEEVEHPKDTTILPDTTSSEFFGFVKNKDVATTPMPTPHAPPPTQQEVAEIPEEIKEEVTQEETKESFTTESTALFQGSVEGVKHAFSELMPHHQQTQTPKLHTKRPTMPSFSMNIWVWIIGGIGTILLLIVGYIFLVHATITITLQPNTIENTQPITFAKGASDVSKSIIGTTEVATDEQGSLSAPTTGSKDIGTNAKGQVTIFSRLTNTTTLAKGTTLISSNNISFTLDQTTTIASFSGGPDDPSVTQSNVAVTASGFGTDANLPSGTKFIISGQSKSDVSAKNDTAFSGGTKNTVTVVSQKDIDTLLATLTKNLETNAISDMQKKIDGSFVLLTNALGEEITTKTPSKAVGDSSNTISIQATIHYTAQSYSKNDVTMLSQDSLKSKIPDYTTIASSDITQEIKDITKKDDKTLLATLHSSASLLPPIDIKTLQNTLTGKTFDQATNSIKAIPQVTDMTIVLSPPLPFLPRVLPRLTPHITIIVKKQ